MKSKKVQEDEEKEGEKKESAGSFSLKTMILAIADTVENKNAMLLLDFFFSMYLSPIILWNSHCSKTKDLSKNYFVLKRHPQ